MGNVILLTFRGFILGCRSMLPLFACVSVLLLMPLLEVGSEMRVVFIVLTDLPVGWWTFSGYKGVY